MGPPEDVDGECNARLYIGDDYGDNRATMRCQLKPNHDGLHKEKWGSRGALREIVWEGDDRELDKC